MGVKFHGIWFFENCMHMRFWAHKHVCSHMKNVKDDESGCMRKEMRGGVEREK